jgi:hypothetical protein
MIPRIFLNIAEQTMDQMQLARLSFKDRIHREWEQSKDLPRKKKKAKRKELLFDLAIADYNPLDYDYNEMKKMFNIIREDK